MYRLLISTLSFIFLIHASLFATVIDIPADYPTIQQGIDVSINGDTVLVQPGTYVENINFSSHNIVLGSLFLTTGDTSYVEQTIIDGSSSGSVVIINGSADSSTIIMGFTIQNGSANIGGAILCNTEASPSILHNLIRTNVANERGGGIYCDLNSGPVIRMNIFQNNSAQYGGGAIYFYYTEETHLENNLFYSNSSEDGGAICMRNSYVNLINNTIAYNSATAQGGGIYCWNSSFINAKNCIIWGNVANEDYQLFLGTSTVESIMFCDIQGGWPGSSNVSIDPLFRNHVIGDFRLMSVACGDSLDSPGIDAGHPGFQDTLLDCSWGLGTAACDLGAFGGGMQVANPGGIINVPYDYSSIQAAILASWHADTVLVQPGTYYENIRFYGRNITVGSMFIMTGDISYIDSTIIDGGLQGRVVTITANEDSTASLSGFTIKQGTEPDGYGGGIYCDHSSPVIANNIIKNNFSLYGGGISCNSSTARIIDNIIEYNTASGDSAKGGGIYCTGWIFGPFIKNNQITANNTVGDNSAGGGIYCEWTDANIYDNIISHNSAGTHAASGAGAYFNWCDVYMINNIISDNYISGTLGDGGGIEFSDSRGYFYNNIVFDNHGIRFGGLHFHANDFLLQVKNSIVRGNLPYQITTGNSPVIELTYCNIQDTIWSGIGNIDVFPLFRDTASGDFHLMSIDCGDSADSPCIDAGDPNIPDSLLDCSWGLGGIRSDMGAYGGGDSVTVGIMEESPITPVQFMLFQNYPNPFNASTIIRFAIPQPQYVKLTIYDLLGRRIGNLLDEYKQAGIHSVTFDASRLSSGIYFYSLQAGERVEVRKMVLLK